MALFKSAEIVSSNSGNDPLSHPIGFASGAHVTISPATRAVLRNVLKFTMKPSSQKK